MNCLLLHDLIFWKILLRTQMSRMLHIPLCPNPYPSTHTRTHARMGNSCCDYVCLALLGIRFCLWHLPKPKGVLNKEQREGSKIQRLSNSLVDDLQNHCWQHSSGQWRERARSTKWSSTSCPSCCCSWSRGRSPSQMTGGCTRRHGHTTNQYCTTARFDLVWHGRLMFIHR